MRTLYHFPLCPFSRMIRVALKEKNLLFSLQIEPFWEKRHELLQLNSAGQIPVLIEPEKHIITHSSVICEYLEETYTEQKLMPDSPCDKAEMRRLMAWCNEKLYKEVICYLLHEKIICYYNKQHQPDSYYIRLALENVKYHLVYFNNLYKKQSWLAGDMFSYGDIAVACSLSVIDYLGYIHWKDYPYLHEYYAIIKSRPSFRPLLADRIYGFPPPPYYADPDF